jgi:hypothetical protein
MSAKVAELIDVPICRDHAMSGYLIKTDASSSLEISTGTCLAALPNV